MNQIAIMDSKIEVLGKQLDAANDELNAIKEAHRQVMDERCPEDEVHCSCVPILRTEIENLKCCGNCKHYTPRGDCRSKHEYRPGQYCDFWQPDGLTRKDRE